GLEEAAQRETVGLHLVEELGLEQVAVPLEGLLGWVGQRLRLVPELGEPSAPRRSTSSVERPLVGVTLTSCDFPVPRSLASPRTIPFSSIRNATWIFGTPRGAGGIPVSSKRARLRQSAAISR